MKTNIKELSFEEFIQDQLHTLHDYEVRQASQYDKSLCMDADLVIQFIKKTQPEKWEKLEEQYGLDTKKQFLKRLDSELSNPNRKGVLEILRKGITDRGVNFKLAFWKPGSALNPDAWQQYERNIFSVIRQVKFSLKNEKSIDLVIFINGLPIFTIELKNQLTGQTVKNAMEQYQTDRDPKEKLLTFKRCLTHFSVDTEQVYMTTKLAGLATKFLPFNKGDKNSSGNPIVEKKYKTHYLWEHIWSKDSILDLLANFIHLHIEEIENADGRTTREEILFFPRYHQLDTVKRIINHTKEHGVGNNYLIQHSAGSGKSNTIAWTAHRLSELHSKDGKKTFDTVVIVTDRRLLDRQLSEIVESFSQVRGVVKHVDSSAELKEALGKGIKIITSTLQKFPVIVDTIEATEGKTFAVIIDEAHSSQSGESAADLRQVLTLDEAEKEAEKTERVFKTTEDLLNERIKARKVKTPNISFLAFTATPKQKTLELFGTQDPLSKKYYPFSLYSMKQAIEEGFILDVLKNYTTYQTFFELLKKIEDDPEYAKKIAQRLLIGYVERHEHAIGKKVKIMVEHFEEKIANEINGKAKAMIVTKSRLHAVKYKLALDKYLKEKKYPHKALVAFSGTVRDGKLHYTESQMNKGVSEKQTANEFKKDKHRFLIAANKFQTGFDQPLLAVMYVDKKLGGVNAVQTLSRLNRIAHRKTDTFVLDFVNTTDEIKDSFQPYYTTTVLSEGTDPNILYDLKRDIVQFKLFADHEVKGFVEDYFNGKDPDIINAALEPVVDRFNKLLEQEQNDFKTKAKDYIKKYGFISQIITFKDTTLEELFIFLKLLVRKLPIRKNPLPYEILEAINMDSYKIEKKAKVNIPLKTEEGTIDPMGLGTGRFKVEEEIDPLSKIIKDINERFGAEFNSDDKVILNSLSKKLLDNTSLEGSIKNNNRDAAKIKFDRLFQSELVTMLNSHFGLYKKLDVNPELKNYVNNRIFEYVSNKVTQDASINSTVNTL